MHQFDKSTLIAFNPHDSESLAAALLQYQQHLEDGSAFRKQVFNIEFVALENNGQRRLQLSDISDETLRTYVRDALRLTPDGYSESSHEAIAEELGISLSAAKVRLHRARRRLRQQVFPMPGGER